MRISYNARECVYVCVVPRIIVVVVRLLILMATVWHDDDDDGHGRGGGERDSSPPPFLRPFLVDASYSDNDLAHHSSVFGRSSVRSGLWLFSVPLRQRQFIIAAT